MTETRRIRVTESSQAGEARRAAVELARRLGFDETEQGAVALVVTEAANNLHRHARDGELLLRPLPDEEGAAGISMLAIDRGPGMADVSASMRDGHSTAGTAGKGLGAIRRLSSNLDLYSQPGAGTVLHAELWPRRGGLANTTGGSLGVMPRRALETGAVCLPVAGEEVCGDNWTLSVQQDRYLLAVVDGLGHGLAASLAAREGIRLFRDNAARAPSAILEALHAGLRSTRGAAAAVADLDPAARSLRYAGIGNISGTLLRPEGSQSLVSHNGTVGHQVRKIQEFSYPWPAGALLVLHSDGLGSAWRLDRYPGLVARHPEIIAAVLYRDFRRERDDVTVVVARERRQVAT